LLGELSFEELEHPVIRMRFIEQLSQLLPERLPVQRDLEALLNPVENRRLEIRQRDPKAIAHVEPRCYVAAAHVVSPLAAARLLVRAEPLPAMTAHD
jgi:hypothetical protein